MKALLTLIIFLSYSCFSQTTTLLGSPTGTFSIGDFKNCGTWESKPIYYTQWLTIDTLSNQKIFSDKREWIEGPEEEIINNWHNAVYAPCGLGTSTKWHQLRICKITGIRQERYKIQDYEYIPKPPDPKTEYEKTVESFLK